MLNADGSEADELARLEAALDRIAVAPRPHSTPPDTAAVAERLDALIAQMRDALAVDPLAVEA
jgi:hypothetical protein